MNLEEVENKIFDILNKKFPNITLNKNMSFFKDLGMDSLDYAEVVIELEYSLQTNILEKQISWQNIKTIEHLSLLFFDNLNL